MIKAFIDFAHELFPSISPYTKENVKEAIKQFEAKGRKFNFFLYDSLEYLSQGDIIGELPFTYYTSDGKVRKFKSMGLLLSNTCDAENDDTIIFAPLIPINDFDGDPTIILKNMNYRLLHFPDKEFHDYVVDFGLMNSYSTKLIGQSIESKKLNKIASLNDIGYYLFLCKLTVHFLRPEDKEVQMTRCKQLAM